MTKSLQGASPSSRYFYTDPLAAAWMMMQFGMRFVDGLFPGHMLITAAYLSNLVNSGEDTCKLRIHPDSLHLLDPRGDDLIQIGDDLIYWICDNDDFWERYRDEPHLKYNFIGVTQAWCFFDDQQGKVLVRDGKPFHWPKCVAA